MFRIMKYKTRRKLHEKEGSSPVPGMYSRGVKFIFDNYNRMLKIIWGEKMADEFWWAQRTAVNFQNGKRRGKKW